MLGNGYINKERELSFENIVSSMAHEIKNPISLISANVDYLLAINEQIKGEKNFNIIKKELNRLLELTQEYTNFFKYSNEKPINVYLYDLIYSIYSDYNNSYTHIKFDFMCEDEEVYVKGNYIMIDIAIRNLIKNSIEAIGDKEGKILIRLIKTNEITKIVIEDNGGGLVNITKENANKLYQTTKKGGTGLGLNIVSFIVKEHSGYFELTETKEGCIATILL